MVFPPDSAWALESDDAFILARSGICETLVKIDFDGQLKPSLAESWERVDDTTWEFKLRSGVTFQNGEPFNAQAVVKAIDHIRSVATLPRGFTSETIVSTEAAGDDTVVIHAGVPDSLMPNRLSSVNVCILAPSAYKADGGIDPVSTGTGPFVLAEEIPEQSIRVVRNENYWGGPVALDEATVLFVPDPAVRAGMVQTGEADVVFHVPIPQVPILEADSSITVIKILQPRTVTLYLNNSRPPFDDVRVRQAVQYAIDKQAIVAAILEGIGAPAIGPFPSQESAWFNTDLQGYAFDPEKAKVLLAEAGYDPGELTVNLWAYPTRAELPPMAVAVQKMLADVGVVSEVRIADFNTLNPDVLAGNYDLFFVSRGHLLDTYDPEGFLSADYSCEGSNNWSNYCNPALDALLAQVRGMDDAEVRYDIYRQIQTMLVDEEAVSVFINHTEQIFAHNQRALNLKIHLLEHYLLTPELDASP
jgi:peptide/nickel transport system substrate-binding protein